MAAATPSEGTTIRVRVQPKASGNQVLGFQAPSFQAPDFQALGSGEDVLRLRVTAPPEDGKANAAVVRLLAQTLGIPRSHLEVVRGKASRDKVISISSLDAREVRRRLETLG